MVSLEERTQTMAEKSKLQQMRDKLDAVDSLIDTLDIHHHEAYTKAADEHLKKEGVEEYDYDRLKKGDTQEKFAQSMADFYVEKARARFGISKQKKLSDTEVDMLLSAYANITKGELLEFLRSQKHRFKLQAFSNAVRGDRGLLAQVRAKLEPSASSHVQDTLEDRVSLVEQMGLKGKVDPKYMTREQVLSHARTYHKNKGVISPRDYEEEVYAKK